MVVSEPAVWFLLPILGHTEPSLRAGIPYGSETDVGASALMRPPCLGDDWMP